MKYFRLNTEDEWGMRLADFFSDLQDFDEGRHWQSLFALMAEASHLVKPSQVFLSQAATLIERIGTDSYQKKLEEWLEAILFIEPQVVFYEGEEGDSFEKVFLTLPPNEHILKGLIHSALCIEEETLYHLIKEIALKAYAFYKGFAQPSVKIGNAAVATLAQSQQAAALLIHIRDHVKKRKTQIYIDSQIQKAAEAQGKSKDDFEDQLIPDFGFDEGLRKAEFGEYWIVAQLQDKGKIKMQWYKPYGSKQKTLPATVKKQYAWKWQGFKDKCKEAEKTLQAQRNRLEAAFYNPRVFAFDYFVNDFTMHAIFGFFAKKLIWQFERTNGLRETGIWQHLHFVDAYGKKLEHLAGADVQLWHPTESLPLEREAWQEYLREKEITQPFPQAFRSTYEIENEEWGQTACQRLSGLRLQQNRFRALARVRDWKYKRFANAAGFREATRNFLHYKIEAECWFDVSIPRGGLGQVSLEIIHIQFRRYGVAMLLNEVPAVVFSEVLRDVHFFARVAALESEIPEADFLSEGKPSPYSRAKYLKNSYLIDSPIGEQIEINADRLTWKGEWHIAEISLEDATLEAPPQLRELLIAQLEDTDIKQKAKKQLQNKADDEVLYQILIYLLCLEAM
ncbi:MAG: DUF4132 domain-containing protein [Bernardetiaceae bacterium]|nr:DUF4132 domain-containing protein [Bernardetiaceae bacterium]